MTNRYSSEMDERPITLVPLTPKQWYDDQLKLKKGNMDKKKESLDIMKTVFANKVLLSFDNDVIFSLGIDFFFMRWFSGYRFEYQSFLKGDFALKCLLTNYEHIY
jgi:hypothetical protein